MTALLVILVGAAAALIALAEALRRLAALVVDLVAPSPTARLPRAVARRRRR